MCVCACVCVCLAESVNVRRLQAFIIFISSLCICEAAYFCELVTVQLMMFCLSAADFITGCDFCLDWLVCRMSGSCFEHSSLH